jgi:hypothetical protein
MAARVASDEIAGAEEVETNVLLAPPHCSNSLG